MTLHRASMGPRLFNRGKLQAFGLADLGFPASMGPRLFNRGKPIESMANGRRGSPLQWGRGYSTAENASYRTCMPPWRQLQWGRGYSTAENYRWEQGVHEPDLRFNGAAVIQPRKSCGQVLGAKAIVQLQWGRGYSTAEKQW